MIRLHLTDAEIQDLPADIRKMVLSSEEVFPEGAVFRVFEVSDALWNATHNAIEEAEERLIH